MGYIWRFPKMEDPQTIQVIRLFSSWKARGVDFPKMFLEAPSTFLWNPFSSASSGLKPCSFKNWRT